jgi:hypothetical protein
VRATIRTRRSSPLSTRVTRAFATRRSTAMLIEPGQIDDRAIVLTGKGPLCSRLPARRNREAGPVSSRPAAAYLVGRVAFIITSQACGPLKSLAS